jgi:hypothetical protein
MRLAGLELALELAALILFHLDPALALASILPFAVILGALAFALAGAAVGAKAAALDFDGQSAAD